MIAGDVFTTYGRVTVTNELYWRFPFAYPATWDKAKDLESAERLRALNPTDARGRTRSGRARADCGDG